MQDRLSEVQRRALVALASLPQEWVLTGGGALVGFYLGHRETRDLDLFFHGLARLERLPDEAFQALSEAGFSVRWVQRTPAFCRMSAEFGGQSVLVDLVAEPVPNVYPAERHTVGETHILVDSPSEILVNKLAALYSRSEIRDLVDVQALVMEGEDLAAAIGQVHLKDTGFSPADLAWVLRSLNVRALARADGYDSESLASFRDSLVDRLIT